MLLQLVVIPVADIDVAKAFYADRAGFELQVDYSAGDFRVVQLTPPGSACSISLMRNPEAAGSVNGLHLIVRDVLAAAAELSARGVEVSPVFHYEAGAQQPGPDPQRRAFNSFASFTDPDGTGWVMQEVVDG